MAGETMSSKERVMAAMQLEKPDRVPIDILASGAPFARMAGITQTEFFSNEEKAFDAINKVFDYTGGWDLDLASIPPTTIHTRRVRRRSSNPKTTTPSPR